MGLPALRKEQRHTDSRPRLRLVTRSAGTKRRPGKRDDVAVARQNFVIFAVFAAVFAVLGIGRIWLSVQATETSFEASRLRADIKNERYEGDMLEVRQSALGSPSRIQAIAGRAMDMAPADSITYLDITERKKPETVEAQPETPRAGMGSVLGKVMDLTAGEAHVLLLGDVGLASTP